MEGPEATQWERDADGRPFRRINVRGVTHNQSDHENGTIKPAESRRGSESAPRRVVSSPRSRYESQRQNSDGEYAMASARQPSNPTYTYGFNQEPRNSQPQTPAYNVVQLGRDPRMPQQETSIAPPFTLFPRVDVPQMNYDSSPVGRHEPMTSNSDSFSVRNKLSREGARTYLKQMTSSDPKTVRPFLDDVEKMMSNRNANVAQARGEETDPGTPTLTNYPDGHPIVEGGQQRRFPAYEGYPTDLSRSGNIDQDLSTETQQLNIGGQIGVRRPVGPAMADTSETSQKKTLEGDPPSTAAPSIEPDIRGSSGDHETLDPRYRRKVDAKKFFVRGRVFALLWHESAGDSKPNSELSFVAHKTRDRYGQMVFSHIRRMVVVKERHGYCVCIPINTYGGQGVRKHGLSASERKAHAVIYSSNTSPKIENEEKNLMTKIPIAVDMASTEQKLSPMSRLNFGKPHSVEWNVKVMEIGMVTITSMPLLMGYFRGEMNTP